MVQRPGGASGEASIVYTTISGSAEAGEQGTLTHSWFIGYAPADDPRVAIAVIMAGGKQKGLGAFVGTQPLLSTV